MRSNAIQAIFYNNPDQYPPIINSVRLLANAGFRVEILCRENGERWGVGYPADACVRRIDTRGKGSWQEYFRFVAQVIRYGNPNVSVFIGHDMHGLLPARLLASRYHRPLVYHCHDFADHTATLAMGGRLVRSFERRFARTADLVIVPDKERGQVMEKELGLRQPPLVVANAPIKPFEGTGVALKQALAECNKKYSRIVFRQGRIGKGHALESTLRSVPHWASRDWGFVVMGIGERTYAESLKQLANGLGVADQFVILPPVGYDQLAQFTPGAHLGHALYEPIHVNNVFITTASNKVMEYMAAGLPLLVSDRPAFRSFLDKYRCGITADEKSPESIAMAINQVLGDLDRAREMGNAARGAFEQEFCYERQFAPVISALKSVISQ